MTVANIHTSETVVRTYQSILNAANVTAQGPNHIYVNRMTPFTKAELPAVNVLQGPEEQGNQNVNIYDTNLAVFIEIVALGDSSYLPAGPLVDPAVSEANSIRVEVSKAILADPRLGLGEEKVNWTEEVGSDDPVLNEEGEIPIVVIRMNWLTNYRRPRDDPEFP